MVTIKTDKGEVYRISFNNMLVQYEGRMYHLKGLFKLCMGLPFETLITDEEGGKQLFFMSKGKVQSIKEE